MKTVSSGKLQSFDPVPVHKNLFMVIELNLLMYQFGFTILNFHRIHLLLCHSGATYCGVFGEPMSIIKQSDKKNNAL